MYAFVQQPPPPPNQIELAKSSLPEVEDNLTIWQTILFFRMCLSGCNVQSKTEEEQLNWLRLRLASISLKQRNHDLASRMYESSLVADYPPNISSFWLLIKNRILALEPCQTPGARLANLIQAKKSINHHLIHPSLNYQSSTVLFIYLFKELHKKLIRNYTFLFVLPIILLSKFTPVNVLYVMVH